MEEKQTKSRRRRRHEKFKIFGTLSMALVLAYSGEYAYLAKDWIYFAIGAPITVLGSFALYNILRNNAKTIG